MDFVDLDYQKAAKLYDNLNWTACFYTTALRILSKANWQERIKFDNHIGHQALIAIAHGLKNDDFSHFHLALAMSTLPMHIHGDLKLTYDTIVATIPPPFHEKASSKVSFLCRKCSKRFAREVPTFVVSCCLPPTAQNHEYFEASFPWTEQLLASATNARPNECQECAYANDWTLESVASCRLVWLQYSRVQQPQACHYQLLLGKDAFYSGGSRGNASH